MSLWSSEPLIRLPGSPLLVLESWPSSWFCLLVRLGATNDAFCGAAKASHEPAMAWQMGPSHLTFGLKRN